MFIQIACDVNTQIEKIHFFSLFLILGKYTIKEREQDTFGQMLKGIDAISLAWHVFHPKIYWNDWQEHQALDMVKHIFYPK